MTSAPSLAGRRILVTRPAAQAEASAKAIAAAGGEALCFPLIGIAPAGDPAVLRAALAALPQGALVFFVSPNAVTAALHALPEGSAWPAGVRVAAVGNGTASVLREHGLHDVIVPQQGFDSEAVLALPTFAADAVAGQAVLILRGDGGRELLADTLTVRGARVQALSCYRRLAPAGGADRLLALAARADALSLTASEAVHNLLGLYAGVLPDGLRRLPAFASHARIRAAAEQAGFVQVFPCAPGDAGLIEAVAAMPAAQCSGGSASPDAVS